MDWGGIGAFAGGINQGNAQNLKTIYDIQREQREADRAEMEKNKNTFLMNKLKEEEKPVFLDTYRQNNPNIGENVFNALKSKAEAAGLLYNSVDGRQYFKRGQGKEFLSFLGTNDKEELIGAQLKDLLAKKDQLAQTVAQAKNPDEAVKLKAQLDQVTQEADNLSYQSTAYLKKKMMEKERSNPLSNKQYVNPQGQLVIVNENDPNANAVIQENGLKPYSAEGKTQSEEQLTARALKGDQEAGAILKAMQARKIETARAGAAAMAGEKDKALDVPALAQSVIDGQDAPIAIKGSMGNPLAAKVKTEVLKKNPKFRFDLADANYKWKQSAVNQRTINFAGGALPRLTALDEQLSALPNVDINAINRIMAATSKEFGKPEYTNFESNRNAIVQEVNTALSGSSQASDMRIVIELENLKSARSPAQIRGAISNLREALIARVDVDLSPLYPQEVVKGEKTMEQYKKEMFDKYRGKYGVASQAGSGSAAPKNDMDAFWKK